MDWNGNQLLSPWERTFAYFLWQRTWSDKNANLFGKTSKNKKDQPHLQLLTSWIWISSVVQPRSLLFTYLDSRHQSIPDIFHHFRLFKWWFYVREPSRASCRPMWASLRTLEQKSDAAVTQYGLWKGLKPYQRWTPGRHPTTQGPTLAATCGHGNIWFP